MTKFWLKSVTRLKAKQRSTHIYSHRQVSVDLRMFLLVQIIDDERQRLLCVQGLYVAIEQMPPEIYISQQDSLRQAYFYRKLYHFAYLLGSAEIESTSDDFRDRAYRITATPLLSQSVQFQFGVAPIFLTRRSSYKTVKTKTGIFCAGP